MQPFTQPIREEHRELIPRIERLREIADQVGDIPAIQLRAEIDEVFGFLEWQLIPHAQAENEAVYPVVARYLGGGHSTATMVRDHVAIAQMAEQLGLLRIQFDAAPIDPQLARELRRLLYGLHAVLMLHFAKEEEIYLPLLDEHLTPHEVKWMLEDMKASVERTRSHDSAMRS
jgi:iron-sulfur cluster repair protein YtfE (RIC family)